MRCNPLRWLWGVVLVIGLLGVMNLRGVLAEIESDLEQRSQSALGEAGLGWARIDFAGRDGILSGRAVDEGDQRRAGDVSRGVWGVRSVQNKTELIEEQKNYVWSASLRESRLRLTGFVPNEAIRKAIIGAAKATFPQLEIDDRMKLARGVPETESWLGAVSFALKQLSALKAGARVDLDGTGLAIEGEAEDFAAYRLIKSALANAVPQGVRVKSDKTTPPVAKPYVWIARVSGAQAQLEGFVPSEQIREMIFAGAQKAFAKRAVVDRLQIASGEPQNLVEAALGALQILARLDEGTAEIKDSQVLVSGTVLKQEAAEELRGALRSSLPDSFRVSEQIKFLEPTVKPVVPYVTTVAVESAAVALSGYAPSEAARVALTAMVRARLPGRAINDGLQLGAGAPEGWQACLAAAFSGLAKLGNGRAELENRALRFAAVTDSEELSDAIRGELRAAANRACDLDLNILVNVPPEPDLTWRALSAGGELTLEGEVPDDSVKSDLGLAAARLFPKARLVDRMELKPAYSKKWPRVSDIGLKILARLRTGEVRLSGTELLVSGEAPDAAVVAAIRQQLRDLPKGYTGRDAVEVRSDAMIWAEQEARRKAEAEARRKADEARQKIEEEERKAAEEARRKSEAERARQEAAAALRAAEVQARQQQESAKGSVPRQEPASQELAMKQAAPDASADGCRRTIDEAIQRRRITFERASATLQKEGIETLERLVAAVAPCPKAQILIEGHTDAEGTPERNQSLSDRRAQAVVDYLVSQGLAADRLTAVGYGATRPLARNDTPEERAVNRRIEFTVTTR